MKIVLISTSDIGHGAGVAAFRLCKALSGLGINATLMVAEKLSNDPNVVNTLQSSNIFTGLAHLIEKILAKFGPQNIVSLASLILHRRVKDEPDVLHFHNLHLPSKGFSLLSLWKYSYLPLVWTMHDMWAFTGHCFYSQDCYRWKVGCGACPYLSEFIGLGYDTSALQWRLKKWIYSKTNIVIVAPSQWMKAQCAASPMFSSKRIEYIPYGVDLNVYKPSCADAFYEKYNIPRNHKIIAFVASSVADKRKGFSFFEQALMKLGNESGNVTLLIVGGDYTSSRLEADFNVVSLGHVSSDERMAEIYSAIHMLVMPTLIDNLPNVLLECAACGTPIVAFDSGGVSDIVRHKRTGYLTKPGDVAGLQEGVRLLLEDEALYNRLSQESTSLIRNEFSAELSAARYIDLYQELANKNYDSR